MKAGILLIFVVTLCLSGFHFSSLSDKQSGGQSEALRDEKNQLKRFLSQIKGTIIFDSSLSGSFGIYAFNPHSLEPEVLVDTASHEQYPDPAPDGSSFVYSVTRDLLKDSPSEIWMAARDGSRSHKLIDSGAFPTFSADGLTIFYEFEKRKVMAYSLADRTTKEIFPKNRSNFRGRPIVKPRISPNADFIAFATDAPEHWHSWVSPLSRGKPSLIHRGCQPTWFPDGKKLAWVKRTGARAKAGIMWHAPESTPKNGVLKDDGAPMGHEYFPTITNDGKYLLYASCPHDQHDHHSAEYSIHVTRLESGETHVLTNGTTTDRWPKLLAYR